MSKAPMNKTWMSMLYMKSKICHKFWNPEAPPNKEEEEDITDKIVIVTGANTGIGKETAYQLAKRGAKVILACRDLKKAKGAVEYIMGKVPSAKLEVMQLDLSSLASIRKFVETFESSYDHLDILVNNAGFMTTNNELRKTSDGFEYHMGVNHLGPFLLTRLLVPSLKKAASSSKIVCVSSSNIMLPALDLNDLMMEKGLKRGNSGMEPYDVSKLANSLCIRHFSKKILKSEDKIRVYQLCPGFVKTDIFREESGISLRSISLALVGLTPEYGCETTVWCCVSKKLATDVSAGGGEMYRFCQIHPQANDYLHPDDPKAIELYKKTEEYLGLVKAGVDDNNAK